MRPPATFTHQTPDVYKAGIRFALVKGDDPPCAQAGDVVIGDDQGPTTLPRRDVEERLDLLRGVQL
jgi:hypothetical protein